MMSIESKIKEIKHEIYNACRQEFDLDSPVALQEVLYVDRDLPTGRRTATGFSVSNETLNHLAATTGDPVPGLIIEYRRLRNALRSSTQYLRTVSVDIDGDDLEYSICRRNDRYFLEIGGINWCSADDVLKLLPIYDYLTQHPQIVLPVILKET
jgi:hypothetical protein